MGSSAPHPWVDLGGADCNNMIYMGHIAKPISQPNPLIDQFKLHVLGCISQE